MPAPHLLAPRYLGFHALAIALVATAVLLGLWQYDAWQTRRTLEARDLVDTAPRPMTDLIGPDEPFPGTFVGQPVTFDGVWVPDGTFYVSGREDDGRDGYWAVTPVAVSRAGDPAMLVVRGWVLEPDQARYPPTGEVSVRGWLQPPQGTGAKDPDPDDDVLPQVRIADAVQRVDQDLYGAFVVQDTRAAPEPDLASVTPAALPQASTFTALRNILYAVEWWVFGAFAAVVWWRWVRDEQIGSAS